MTAEGTSRRKDAGPSGKANTKSAWGNPLHNGVTADKSMTVPSALKGVQEASGITDFVLTCAATVLDKTQAGRSDVEAVLSRLAAWLLPPVQPQILQLIANSSMPGAVVRAIGTYRDDPPCAALACVVATRCSGSAEGASAHIRAGAIDEISSFMDRHPNHGGVQNVCLLALAGLLKDPATTRQAVNNGIVARVLHAMEVTSGREVQFNGLAALRLLADTGRHPRAQLQDNPRAPRAGLQEAALRAKVAHQSDNAVCNAANDVLALVTPRFKEVLCWHWQSGWCKLGPRCTYAHGPSDLRGA